MRNAESEFYRIRLLPPYVLEEVNLLKARARARGADIIDFGMGNPDMAPPAHVIDKLVETVRKPQASRYSVSRGIPGLRRAQSAYYARRFGVALDPETEIIVTLGSKEGFANMAQALTGPGDVILTPTPTYPIHTFGFIISGAVIRSVPLTLGEGFEERYLSALGAEAARCHRAPSVVVVNFPSNPTAQTVTTDFYRELVAFARRREMLILSDLAYAEIYFDENTPPPSILEIPGAKDLAVEFTSMSKTYAMPGWRIGFGAGNPRMIGALARVKSYLDYGAFTPVQVAASAALNGPQDCVREIRQTYRRRRDVFLESMARAGWVMPAPVASMFVWAPVPEPMRAQGSLAFARMLLHEADVAAAPGTGFGAGGEGYMRIGLVENEQRIRQAARNVRRLMARLGKNPSAPLPPDSSGRAAA